jgi:hypothetical protein
MDASASIYRVAAGSTNAGVGEDGPIGVWNSKEVL